MSPTLCCSQHPREDYKTLGQIISPPSFLSEVETKSWIEECFLFFFSFEEQVVTQRQTVCCPVSSIVITVNLQLLDTLLWVNVVTGVMKLLPLELPLNHKCNLLPTVPQSDQLEAAPAVMSMNKPTRCYWNLGWKCYSPSLKANK